MYMCMFYKVVTSVLVVKSKGMAYVAAILLMHIEEEEVCVHIVYGYIHCMDASILNRVLQLYTYMYATYTVRVHVPGGFITLVLLVTVGLELGGEVCLVRLVWFVVDEYYCSETTTTQACLGYVNLGRCRATMHTRC